MYSCLALSTAAMYTIIVIPGRCRSSKNKQRHVPAKCHAVTLRISAFGSYRQQAPNYNASPSSGHTISGNGVLQSIRPILLSGSDWKAKDRNALAKPVRLISGRSDKGNTSKCGTAIS